MKWVSKTNVLGTGRCGQANDCVDPFIVRGAILAIVILVLIVLFNPVETEQEFGSFGYRPNRFSKLKADEDRGFTQSELHLCEASGDFELAGRTDS